MQNGKDWAGGGMKLVYLILKTTYLVSEGYHRLEVTNYNMGICWGENSSYREYLAFFL